MKRTENLQRKLPAQHQHLHAIDFALSDFMSITTSSAPSTPSGTA
jgi:hypothetical protein